MTEISLIVTLNNQFTLPSTHMDIVNLLGQIALQCGQKFIETACKCAKMTYIYFEREQKQQHFITHEFSSLLIIHFIAEADQSKK